MNSENQHRAARNNLPKPSDPQPSLIRTVRGPVAVAEEGPSDGVPVMCVHGVPGSSRDFRYLGPALKDSFHVLRLEMPGFGQSPSSSIDSIEGWSRVIEAVADALGLRSYILASHSFGAASVIRVASRHPDRVRGLALLAPLGSRRHRGFAVPPFVFGIYAKLLENPYVRPNVWRRGLKSYEKLRFPPPKDWRELRLHAHVISTTDFRRVGREAREIKAPTALVHADDDRLIQVEIVRELAGVIPNSTLLEFPDGGHHVQKTRAHESASLMIELFLGRP